MTDAARILVATASDPVRSAANRPPAPSSGRMTTSARHWSAAERWWIVEGSVPHQEARRACRRRALLLWPRLDRSRLAQTRGDPWRIAQLVSERSPRPVEVLVEMLTMGMAACPVGPARLHREGT
jgi:hypothetical protein